MNEREQKEKKAELVGILHREKGSLAISSLLALLGMEIERMRDEIENCTAEDLPAYQGAIGAFRGLKDLIEDGYPDFKS